MKAALELQDAIQPFRDMRDRPNLLDLDTFIFAEQVETQAERAARLRVIALELELTASYIRHLLEHTVLSDLADEVTATTAEMRRVFNLED